MSWDDGIAVQGFREIAPEGVLLSPGPGNPDEAGITLRVIDELGFITNANIEAEVTAAGPERVVRVVTRFLDDVITNPGMKRWLAEEGESAMRLLTRHETGFQPRLIEAVEDMLRDETDAGRLALSADLHEVAYVIVRLIESYTYLDLITDVSPGAGRAGAILGVLMRA